jgi:hypothetical protein
MSLDLRNLICGTVDTENMDVLRVELWDSDTISDDLQGS